VTPYANRPDISRIMSFWRPSDNCIYVISDILGKYNELKLILNRILPLRRTGGQTDSLIFLGNYIGGFDAHKVVDLVIEAKFNQPDQIVCILGDKELRLQSIIRPETSIDEYRRWMSLGGDNTLAGYLERMKSENTNPFLIKRQYITRFIPKEHFDFFVSLSPYYENDDYIFVHGGCDPNLPLVSQSPEVLSNDRSVFELVRNSSNIYRCPWGKTVVTGHVGMLDGKPLIRDKFITLDGSYAEKLYVIELNSRTLFSARKGKNRLVKELIT
jgi:hypothetical protein